MQRNEEAEDILRALDPTERSQLERLRERVKKAAPSPEEIAAILPEAVLRGDEGSRRLSNSMVEITERAIELSVRGDPERLSTSLFPIIGAAIRKALNKLLTDTMNNMNAGMEKTFSVRRLGWRLEAWKTGVPFMEIVLRHTLKFRVEHVFLIHGKTGLLLRALSREGAKTADDDMVASMLTAVRDYIKDSLALRKAESVNGITAGEYSIMVEEGPRASLAVIVRGDGDGSIREAMQSAVETVHLRFARELEAFGGDTSPFEMTEAILKACLLSREAGEAKPKPVYAIVALAFAAAAVVAVGVFGAATESRRGAFVKALGREPGILVASSERRFRKTELRLLRDSRAKELEAVAAEYGIDLSDFDIEEEAFVSPSFVDSPAPTVRTIPEELLALSRKLSAYTLLFEQDSGELQAGQEPSLREAGAVIAMLVERAQALGFSASVEMTGHSAGSVQDEESVSVSEKRAAKALNLFAEVNAPLVKYVVPRGVGVSEPVVREERTEEDRMRNRSVTFKAIFR